MTVQHTKTFEKVWEFVVDSHTKKFGIPADYKEN